MVWLLRSNTLYKHLIVIQEVRFVLCIASRNASQSTQTIDGLLTALLRFYGDIVTLRRASAFAILVSSLHVSKSAGGRSDNISRLE